MNPTVSKVKMGGHRGGNILEFYTEEFRPGPTTIEVFRQHLIQWFFAAKHLRFFEAAVLLKEPSPDNMASHRMVCSALITFGEFAGHYARGEENLNLSAVGLSVEDVEAETRMLRDNFKMFHDTTMSGGEAEDVLKKAFNES